MSIMAGAPADRVSTSGRNGSTFIQALLFGARPYPFDPRGTAKIACRPRAEFVDRTQHSFLTSPRSCGERSKPERSAGFGGGGGGGRGGRGGGGGGGGKGSALNMRDGLSGRPGD